MERFVSSCHADLKDGYVYTYVVNVKYELNGTPRQDSKEIKLRPGDTEQIVFEPPADEKPNEIGRHEVGRLVGHHGGQAARASRREGQLGWNRHEWLRCCPHVPHISFGGWSAMG